jgi:hypothetical protein
MWIKLQCEMATSARVAAAGSTGALVFVAAQIQHTRFGTDGRIPSEHFSGHALKIECVALFADLPVKKVETAIDRVVEVGLLVREDAGSYRLADFDPEQHAPRCTRCHGPNAEPRHATCPKCRASKREGREKAATGSADGSDAAAARSPLGAVRQDPDPTGPDRTRRTGPDPTCTDRPASAGSCSTQHQVEEGSGSAGAANVKVRITDVLFGETTWRANARGRTVEVFKLAKRLESEGATVDDVRRLWAWARRNAKDPTNCGGYFDSLIASEATWRSALTAQAKVTL